MVSAGRRLPKAEKHAGSKGLAHCSATVYLEPGSRQFEGCCHQIRYLVMLKPCPRPWRHAGYPDRPCGLEHIHGSLLHSPTLADSDGHACWLKCVMECLSVFNTGHSDFFNTVAVQHS